MEPTKSPHTLIVDDEEAIRSLLSHALVTQGHAIALADTVEKAYEHLASREFDLLLVDKNLPDGSGLDIIATARKKGHRSEAIVITGYSDMESAIKAVSLGVFRYVRKPFDLAALRIDINNALETGRLRRDLAVRTKDLEETNQELWTALKKVFESERRTRQVERLANIGYLAAGVAHEINNPLSLLSMTIPYVNGECKALLKKLEKAPDAAVAMASLKQMAKSLAPAEEAVEFLMRLASDLHSLGRSDKDSPAPVKLSEVAGSAMRLVRHQLKDKARVVLDIPEEITVRGHASRLVQVFINLLTNAAKAIEGGRPKENKVEIVARKKGERAVITVSDTGIGISRDHLGRIFEPFYTISKDNEDIGSGIGLAIVKEIVESHNGTIGVQSEVGKGTVFTIELVRDAPSISPPVIMPSDDEEMVENKRRILFVDAVTANLVAYKQAFGTMHDVKVAKSVGQALKILEAEADALDIMVCELPADAKERGDFFRHLKRWPELTDRVIFVTEPGPAMDEAQTAGYQVLKKPVRLAVLLGAICRIPERGAIPDDSEEL